jgi:hypothetical protein
MFIELIFKAIKKINPTAQASMSGNDILAVDTIIWENGTPPIAKELILAKVAELQAEYEANQYQRDRANEYPDFKEYLDGIVKGDQAQIDKYIADCLAIKTKYPKSIL